MAWFVLAGVVRLAHFNTLSIRGNAQQAFHRGLPVTYTALIFPLLFLLHGTLAAEIFELGLAGAFALIGLLFIIDMPVPKPRGAFYILLPLVALLLTVYWSGRYLQWFVTA